MQARLLVVGGEEQARQFELRLPAVVGRSRTTDVTLFHPLVSRQHCELFEADGWLMVRDLGSLNGTFVGEARLSERPVPLEPGQSLTVGCIKLTAEYDAPERGPDESAWSPGRPTVESPACELHDEDHRVDGAHIARPASRPERNPRE